MTERPEQALDNVSAGLTYSWKKSYCAGLSRMTRTILHIVSNVDSSPDHAHPTGLWLSELTHAYDLFAAHGYEQTIASPRGGLSPLEPRALKWPLLDRSAKAWLDNPQRMALLSSTSAAGAVDPARFDAIYLTGGHAVMWDFPSSNDLQHLIRSIWQAGGVVAAVCHGYCGLLNVRQADGNLLVEGKHVTGFSWTEEILAGVAEWMPYNAEAEMKGRGALYQKALIPFRSHVVTDGRLVTGQNPFSATATAKAVVAILKAEAHCR